MVAHVLQDNGPEERAEEPHEKSCLHVSDRVSCATWPRVTRNMSTARRYYSSNGLGKDCSNELAIVTGHEEKCRDSTVLAP